MTRNTAQNTRPFLFTCVKEFGHETMLKRMSMYGGTSELVVVSLSFSFSPLQPGPSATETAVTNGKKLSMKMSIANHSSKDSPA